MRERALCKAVELYLYWPWASESCCCRNCCKAIQAAKLHYFGCSFSCRFPIVLGDQFSNIFLINGYKYRVPFAERQIRIDIRSELFVAPQGYHIELVLLP